MPVEHVWAAEYELRWRKVGYSHADVLMWRYVCSCGHATSWSKDQARVLAAIGRHAMAGQISFM